MTENPQKSRTEENNTPIKKKRMGSGFWITLICFSSVWMFVLGVLVGRGTVPVQVDIQKLQNELIALKEAVLRKEKERLENYSREINDKAGLDFYVELKQADRSVSSQNASKAPVAPLKSPDLKTMPLTTKKPEPPAVNPPATTPDNPPAQAKPQDKRPDEKKKKIEKKESGRWEVQVASMKDAAEADKMVEKLKQKGYPAYRFGATIPGKGVWYRVRVGPFKDKTDVEKKLIRLKNDNFSTMLVAP